MNVNDLVLKITTEAQNYYSGNQMISDSEFDSLVSELRSTDPDNPILTTVGWGYDINKINQTKSNHLSSFTGLSKIKTTKDKLFRKSNEWVITAKMDGGSVELQYLNGHLMKALTRGNGLVGIECSNKLMYSQGVPIDLNENYTGNIVGEYVLSQEDALGYTEDNQRNIPNGFLGRISADPDECSKYSFIAYRISYSSSHKFSTHREVLDKLASWNFIVVHEFTEEDDHSFLETLNDLSRINDKTYLLDGIVVNNNKLLEDNHHYYYPESVAYKIMTETATVKVTNVDWNFTRTGKYVPTVEFDPVHLSGADIQRASGFNYKYIKDYKMDVGSVLEITRSGEVIPYIYRVLKPSTKMTNPTKCKYCNETLVLSGKDLVCPNPDCTGKKENELWHFISVVGSVDNMGGTLLGNIIKAFNFTTIESIYQNDIDYSVLESMDGIGQSKIDTVKKCINKIRNESQCLEVYLVGLSIKGLGYSSAKKLADLPRFKEALLNESTPSANIINSIQSLGQVSYTSKRYVLDNWNELHELIQYFNISDNKSVSSTPSTTDLIKVCITGKLQFGTKKKFYTEYKDSIVESDISDCKYLVCNEDKNSNKLKYAKDKGISIITEDQLVNMITL